MTIEIDGMSEAELHALFHRVRERLLYLRARRDGAEMRRFAIGERVAFETVTRDRILGVLVRYNRKSVTVIADDGRRWTVAPQLLLAVVPGNP